MALPLEYLALFRVRDDVHDQILVTSDEEIIVKSTGLVPRAQDFPCLVGFKRRKSALAYGMGMRFWNGLSSFWLLATVMRATTKLLVLAIPGNRSCDGAGKNRISGWVISIALQRASKRPTTPPLNGGRKRSSSGGYTRVRLSSKALRVSVQSYGQVSSWLIPMPGFECGVRTLTGK
jgi:hypothetical protein